MKAPQLITQIGRLQSYTNQIILNHYPLQNAASAGMNSGFGVGGGKAQRARNVATLAAFAKSRVDQPAPAGQSRAGV